MWEPLLAVADAPGGNRLVLPLLRQQLAAHFWCCQEIWTARLAADEIDESFIAMGPNAWRQANHRGIFRHHERNATHDERAAQRHDEGRHFQLGDDDAPLPVKGSATSAERVTLGNVCPTSECCSAHAPTRAKRHVEAQRCRLPRPKRPDTIVQIGDDIERLR